MGGGLRGSLPPGLLASHALQHLGLQNNRLTGSLPDSWANSKVRLCRSAPAGVNVRRSGLVGCAPLCWPPCWHPLLACAAGPITRPPSSAWRPHPCPQSLAVLQLTNNSLEGPALPPAWLAPGALPALWVYDVGENQGLTGTLPADLPWPSIADM